MAAGTVTVGGQRYAVGLYWENSPSGGRVTQIAKEAAKQPGMQADFYAVRSGNKDGRVPQFGLCSRDAGQKSGMLVLAGCLANQVPGSWAGAFRLTEGVAVIVVRDDLIVPDGDMLYQDEAEARDRLIQEIGFGGLQTTYAPESWSLPGADTIPLTLLISNRQDVKLQQVSIPKNVKMAAMALGVVFVLVIGGVWYWQAKIDEENALKAQQEEALRRAQQALLPQSMQSNKPPEPKYERYWEEAPQPLALVDACRAALAKVSVGVAGWKITTGKCTKSSLTIGWLYDKGMAMIPPGAQVDESGRNASQTIALDSIPARGNETLADPDVIMARYLAQNWDGTIGHSNDDPPPPPPPGYSGQWNPPPPPWVKRSFTLNVAELPSKLPEYFSDLPGVIINSMNFTLSGSATQWVIEGVIYENRK